MTLTTTTIARQYRTTLATLRAWTKAIEAMLANVNTAAEPSPGRNGRLFGYRPTASSAK
ncbi:hypothetical protein [Anatilimnocola floriformis]|uniref:hypothetical protein n=1 Tax=Anatilimnocola floriformis TaxID=2948575 RepID=UPI0020C38921|nr:hypothetical protein [Anatilimnocola floriformis]